MNRYAYVNNSSLSFFDPLGLCGDAVQWDESTYTVTGSVPCGNGLLGGGGSGGGGSTDNPPNLIYLGGSHAGRGGSQPSKNTVKQTICSAIPQGRVTSVNGSIGGVGGEQGSVQQVVNYNNGEVSNFATGGVQAGWNGGASASASMGYVYKKGNFTNSDFSGPFSNLSVGSAEGPGVSASWASNGVKVVQGSVGVTLVPGATATYSYTWTSQPKPAGDVWTNANPLLSPLSIVDLTLYGIRKVTGC